MRQPERKAAAGLPRGLVILAFYLTIKVVVIEHHPALSPLVAKVWWETLASRGLLILAMAALIPLQLRREGLDLADLGYRPRWTTRTVAWGVAAGAVVWFVHDALLGWAARHAGPGWVNAGVRSAAEAYHRGGPAEEFGAWLGSVVMAPLIEETVYRACLIASFRRRWGGGAPREAAYVLASAVLFAAAHQLSHPLYGAVYAVTGAGLGLVYVRTRSLNAAIAAHAVINALFQFRAFGH